MPVVFCHWSPTLENPDAIAAPDGTASSETTAADTTRPDATPAAVAELLHR
jgi:hypothetical protein